jgi:antitoxin MazE
MLTKVQKWGNSLGLRIPKSFAEEAAVEEGSTVDLSVADGELRIRPVRSRKYELKELLSEVCEENIHTEVTTGDPQGRENW